MICYLEGAGELWRGIDSNAELGKASYSES